MSKAKSLVERRRQRVRTKLRKRAGDRARLSVFRSSQHIYAQVIDDARGHTVAAAMFAARSNCARQSGSGRLSSSISQ